MEIEFFCRHTAARWCLIIAGCGVMLLHWSIHFGGRSLALAKESNAKGQAETVTLSDHGASIDFLTIEQLIWNHALDGGTEFTVGPDTLNLFESIFNHIQSSSGDFDNPRFMYLVKQVYPGEAGDKLASMLSKYLTYQSEFNHLNSQISQQPIDEQPLLIERLLVNLERDQEDLFGKEARLLFESRNRSYTYLMRSRQIYADASLSENQKREQLDKLNMRYRSTVE